MSLSPFTLGIIGGTGALGGAIGRALLLRSDIEQDGMWVSNSSGHAHGYEGWEDINATNRNQVLVDACDIIILSVPPVGINGLGIDATGKLVISVMAGVSAETIRRETGAAKIVRAMSSPVAESGLAYSPWYAIDALTPAEATAMETIFRSCGETDPVDSEDIIDLFTVVTGPVPGFAAYFADIMMSFLTTRGVTPNTAMRASSQLLRSAGEALLQGNATPREAVDEMIDYDGTTAAGMRALDGSNLRKTLDAGLSAALEKVHTFRDPTDR